ncbi:SGNH/GDSL hydrolase family protein [Sphingomonas gei]|uniref:SGNH/GDSL hydrolase family protein n=1 Tax=Sphingomonas gei TaxID=1395960 RepID=A0A4S1XIS8_9SPHN|nr:SGNH/GDSL hydrolase family protein [Sphingomonas gei]TGX55713.1 SGNH/GDSL hydrolase family protein [Sphingomonas gei]
MRRVLAAALLIAALPAGAQEGTWQPAWYAAPFPAIPVLLPNDRRTFENQNVRQFLTVEAEGDALRVRLTNELGTTPLHVGSVRIGRADADGGTIVRFAGARSVDIPAGAPLLSDAIAMRVRRFERLTVSVHYDRAATPAAHLLPVELSEGMGAPQSVRAPGIVSAIEVRRARPRRLVVAIGDSITEGTPDQASAHRSWPQQLSARLGVTVLNAGISGGRLLKDGAGPSLLARLDRDVLAQPGVTDLVLLIGINDIGNGEKTGAPVTADAIIAGYRQVIARAQGRGVRAIGATILPYRGAAYYNERGEAVRRAVNAWVRESGEFDAVIDFAATVADPADPGRLKATFDPGDHLHPNAEGYAAMAATAERVLR